MDFDEILYLSNFRKYVEKIQVALKSDKNNGCFTERPMYIFFVVSLSVLLRMRTILTVSCRENQNARLLFYLFIYLFIKNRAVFETT
jgi:hypothetical protein